MGYGMVDQCQSSTLKYLEENVIQKEIIKTSKKSTYARHIPWLLIYWKGLQMLQSKATKNSLGWNC